MKLASAGDDIKVWDSNGYTLDKKFSPHNNNVSSICWSHDNVALASCSSAGDKIAVSYTQAGGSYEIAKGDGQTCVAFNSTSRYIMGGGPDGIVHVWDLKTRKLKRSYKDHKHPVTSVQFNWNDTVIAAGSETGDIILYNVVTSIGSSPLALPNAQAVRELQYSHFRKSLLGSVSDDGSVSLWDTNARRLVHSFTDNHQAPAMGLAFSPLNEMLLMSVGLDKRIVCYDVQGKTAVRTMTAESPLTSIDLMSDGATLAVGSTWGRIYLYDLREGAVPMQVLTGHKSSVSSLKFSTMTNKNASSGKPSQVTVSSLSRKVPNQLARAEVRGSKKPTANGPPPFTDLDEIPTRVTEFSSSTDPAHFECRQNANRNSLPDRTHPDSNTTEGVSALTYNKNVGDFEEVFSPIRDSLTPTTGHHRHITPNGSIDHHAKHTVLNHSAEKYADGIFSPLAGEISNTSGDRSFPIGANSGSSPVGISRPITTGLSLDDDGDRRLDTTSSSEESSNCKTSSTDHKGSRQRSRSPVVPPRQADLNKSIDSHRTATAPANLPCIRITESSPMSSKATSHRSRSDGFVNRSPRPASTPPDATPSAPGRGEEAGAAATDPRLMNPFQTEFIKSVVDEAMEEFREQIRKDILNLHVDMLKQLQLQQTEIRSMLQQYSVNEDLMAETERLREENRRLKKKF